MQIFDTISKEMTCRCCCCSTFRLPPKKIKLRDGKIEIYAGFLSCTQAQKFITSFLMPVRHSLLGEIVAAIKINFFILKTASDNELDMSSGEQGRLLG